jgi:hypothetical protein
MKHGRGSGRKAGINSLPPELIPCVVAREFITQATEFAVAFETDFAEKGPIPRTSLHFSGRQGTVN